MNLYCNFKVRVSYFIIHLSSNVANCGYYVKKYIHVTGNPLQGLFLFNFIYKLNFIYFQIYLSKLNQRFYFSFNSCIFIRFSKSQIKAGESSLTTVWIWYPGHTVQWLNPVSDSSKNCLFSLTRMLTYTANLL